MMFVLIVDDDSNKYAQVRHVVEDALVGKDVKIERASSVVSAGRMLLKKHFDVLVLDVNLPMRDGGDPRKNGGLVLLRHIRDDHKIHPPSHVIGLTAYDDLVTQAHDEFAHDMWYVIKYDKASVEWEDALRRKLAYVANAQTCANERLPLSSASSSGNTSQNSLQTAADSTVLPLKLLKEAVAAVPAMKYGLGVVGLVSIIAIVSLLAVNFAVAAIGSIVILVLMVAVLLFAHLAKTARRHFLIPSIVLIWGVLLIVLLASALLLTSAFFKWPIEILRTSSIPTDVMPS